MAEGRVRWGVLGAAKIARDWVVPGIHMSDRGELTDLKTLVLVLTLRIRRPDLFAAQ